MPNGNPMREMAADLSEYAGLRIARPTKWIDSIGPKNSLWEIFRPMPGKSYSAGRRVNHPPRLTVVSLPSPEGTGSPRIQIHSPQPANSMKTIQLHPSGIVRFVSCAAAVLGLGIASAVASPI